MASFLALLVFTFLGIIILAGIAGGVISRDEVKIEPGSVLYLDLSRNFSEEKMENPFSGITGDVSNQTPSLYELKEIIRHAEKDSLIKGIYIKSGININGYAASEEIRNALLHFKKSGKFIIAYGDYITQKAFYVSSAADKIYCNPKGVFEWAGMNVEYVFFKDLLNRLEIQPQIFYDGKFKSATEPFREVKMTEASKLQTEVWLGDIYDQLVKDVSTTRKISRDSLKAYANAFRIKNPNDAVSLHLIDGAWYDDEVRDDIKRRLNISNQEKIEFVTPGTYMHANSLNEYGGSDKIALLVAEGDIVDGKGDRGQIGSETFRSLIR
ncbi:MAG: S49 family peptidase, partial [Chitinophagaceae bacterium]